MLKCSMKSRELEDWQLPNLPQADSYHEVPKFITLKVDVAFLPATE